MKNLFRYTLTALIAVAIVSCAKDYDTVAPAEDAREVKTITDPAEQERIMKTIDELPALAVYSPNIDKYILIDFKNLKNGFNFANPNAGVSFTTPNETVTFVQAPDGTFYQVATVDGTSGGGGGIVTAGDQSLICEVVLCFNSGDDFFGLDLFGGSDFGGISGAIGIGGDFSALMEMDESEIEDTDPSEFFTGFVAYYVFDGTADGTYDVIEFLGAGGDDEESENEDLAIAFFVSLQDGGAIFFSSDGTLTFDGSSVTFDGTYLGITDFFFSFGGDLESDDDAEFVEVDGFGTLNCQ